MKKGREGLPPDPARLARLRRDPPGSRRLAQPFCCYNTLYRDGHVPLPPLATANAAPAALRSLPLVGR